MNDWHQYLTEGKQYLSAATGKGDRPPKLTASIRYNLFALALEKAAMALVDMHGDMPDNHTFTDLLEAIGRHVEIPSELRQEILDLEQVQTICSVYDGYHREEPTEEIVGRLADATRQCIGMAETKAAQNIG